MTRPSVVAYGDDGNATHVGEAAGLCFVRPCCCVSASSLLRGGGVGRATALCFAAAWFQPVPPATAGRPLRELRNKRLLGQ